MGWTANDVDVDLRVAWLNPTQTVFPLAAGPGLIQIAMLDKIALDESQVVAIVDLNQSIAAFNATLDKAETVRTSNAVALARIHSVVLARVGALRAAGTVPTIQAALTGAGLTNIEQDLAVTLTSLLEMLHTGLIGTSGGQGLWESYNSARRTFDDEVGG
jgi:hypothetical protein